MENFQVKVGEGTTTILEGKAPDPINFKQQHISGTISAPLNFWLTRSNMIISDGTSHGLSTDGINYARDAAYVEFNYSNRSIRLVVAAAHPSQITVEGSFIVNPIFDALRINKPVDYGDHTALLSALRGKSDIFPSVSSYEDFIERLRNYTFKLNKEVKVANDQKGNVEDSKKYELINFSSLDFELKVPIFVGETDSLVKVKVEVEIRNNSAIFFLVSNELPILMKEYMNQKFEEIKDQFVDIVKIDK